MGFDVLAWESPIYEVQLMEERLRDHDIPLSEATAYGVFQIWTYSGHVKPVFEYARKTHGTESPLEMAGFDMQTGVTEWNDDFIAFMDAIKNPRGKAPIDPLTEAQRETLAKDTVFMGPHSADELLAHRDELLSVAEALDTHADALAEVHGLRHVEFYRVTLRDRIAMLKLSAAYHQARKDNPRGHPDVSETAVRDDLMGKNVAWLASSYYKGRKIILWEATMHAVYDAPKIKHPQVHDFYEGTVTCGNVARKLLGDDLYTIGFIAGQGRAGNVFMTSSFDIGPPAADSLEAVCMMTGDPFLYIDFRSLPKDHWLRAEMPMRPLGHATMNADWTAQMDAVIYTRDMFPSTRDGDVPSGVELTVDR
jgi:erythromycin esterase-like protein